MLPRIPIVRLADSKDLPLPQYADGIGTILTLSAAVVNPIKLNTGEKTTISTGFALSLPVGIEGQIRSHMELSEKDGIIVLNAPATIDASFRGELKVTLLNNGDKTIIIRRGQPIAILVFSLALRIFWNEIKPQNQSEPVEELPKIKPTKAIEKLKAPNIPLFSKQTAPTDDI